MAPAFRWRWSITPFVVLLVLELSNCGSSLDLDTSQMEISAHPISPRSKRQAYPVYSSANGKVTVEVVGQREAGPWNDWTVSRECSLTCGGGVKIETRDCGGSGCIGPRKRYVSCNIEPCAQGAKDFSRASQCSANNDKPLQGRYYKWKPYTKAPNKCELNCMPEGESFYYKWADKVVDGTKCDQTTNDVCVEGFCLPLGCDGKLGSTQKEDKCRVCGGDGTTCKTQKGFFDERHMAPGYIDIITLPVGSTTIVIQENKPTNNYLALRNDSGHYFLNGNWKIDFPQTVEIAGTLFEYERTRQGTVGVERLIAKGPTTEPVIVVLLFQAENTGIQYEYSIPLDETLPHIYLLGEWEQCSATCGKGIQMRKATCVESVSKSPVDDELCVNSSLPETNRTCNSIDCENEWFEGEWEECSRTCGKDGLQYRTVYCHKVSADGTRVTVDDEECTKNASSPRPPVKQNCNRFECPEWLAGPWSSCSKDCGDAMQYRAITCRSEKEGEEGKLLGSKNCNDTMKPEDRRTCNLGPCEGLRWVMGDWQLCSKCNDSIEWRNVSCENEHGRRYPEEKCKEKRPADSRECATVIPCVYKWHASQWSECSSGCGHGHQTRSVICAIDEDGYLRKMDDSFCDPKLKLDGRQNCTHENEKCTGTYYSSPWTNCTAECAGGTQSRIVVCFDYDYKIRPQLCDEDLKPPETQDCNTDRCLLCNETEFGCCPDKMTPASGLYFDGCSNCSLSEFGCCPDNYTAATNADKEGCPIEIIDEDFSGEGMGQNDTMKNTTDVMLMAECETSVFGCCPDGNTTASTADQSDCPEILCNFTSASGDTIMLPCVNVTAMNETDVFVLGNDTMMGMNDTESNVTVEIHCSKTEFGCCPDWYTAANGTDFVGCPEFEIGNCNDTKHGCCPDGLTLARGPKFEGCGDPSCAASLFGCCKDRLTIAFGTHYGGCERANLPCETSKFGCCSDGLTAALGSQGEGCEEDCRLTKFGCCPDGKTTAKGKNNEGCKCSDSQYGCCPDGKTAAEGLNYHGCPDSCARSYYGCCPDGKTAAQGSFNEGCPCVYTKHGCCPDGETAARGPNKEGCDDCRYWKFGCCADGTTKALGPDRSGCDEEMRATTGYTRPPSGTVSPNKIAACTLPKGEGQVCTDYTIMWYYDAKEGGCRQFWYGGCAGNDNRFASEAECRDTCIEPPGFGVCYLPKIEGPQDCGDVKARWYYDLRRGQCAAFYYNGCNGNANNFEDYNECMSRCDSVEIPGEDQRRPDDEYRRPDDEYRRPDDDRRRGEEEHQRTEDDRRRPDEYQRPDDDRRRPEDEYRRPEDDQVPPYDPRTSPERIEPTDFPSTDREDFITPTVRGDRLEEDDTSQSEVCDWPPESGSCAAFRDMWYFDRQSKQCSTFKYGGCDGNPNRFLSREECEQICRHKLASVPLEETQICSLPAVVGPCRARLQKWYYEPALSRCTTFFYGGCDGNENRFDTEQQCQAKCEKTAYDVNGEQCTLPKDSGPCDIYVPKWYFNSADGTCGRFYYGGCHGNRNRFDSLEECETKCSSKIDPCTLPPVQGPCNSRETRWHYDQKSRSCKHFTFGGCLGNSNNFQSANECETKCANKDSGRTQSLTGRTAVLSASVADDNAKSDICQLPPVSGRCGEYHYKYYFNSANSRCEAFVYSGCDGNENRFDRLEECERRCTSRHRSQNYQADVNNNNLLDSEVDAFRTPQIVITTAEPSQNAESPAVVEENDNDDICHLPMDKGPCRQHNVRWFFDTTTRSCKEFIYGGCLGNYNNFETSERCVDYCVSDNQVPQGGLEKPRSSNNNNGQEEIIEERVPPPQSYPLPTSLLPDLCKQPMDTGDCFEDLLRYYYDSEKQRCQSFKYTNCKGNSNRFLSMEECERGCGQYRDPGVCALPADEGHCFASTNKWFWNSASASCETFIYSGCGGNGNRFSSKEECESLCRKETESQSADVCELPKVVGPCRAALERYHYNIRTRQCEKFVYGGCRGNDNNFQSKEDCQKRCTHVESDISDICLYTRDAGPCTESVTQYYYDSPTGECKLFTYGGCRGNKNRFDTKNQCETRCKGKRSEAITMSKEAVCRQPFDHGPCNDQAVRYYYNINANKCETFVYGGCLGNENRFFSEKECTDTCNGVMSRPDTHISSHPRIRETVNVIVEMSHSSHDSPASVFLHCQVRPVQSHNILWFKDNKRINSNENPRFTMMRNGTLHIMSAVKTDGGNYTCAASDINNGLTSNPVIVEIKTQHQQPLKQCVDDPSKANCAMVKKSGLCDHKYYGVFCCKTCEQVRKLKKAKVLKLKA